MLTFQHYASIPATLITDKEYWFMSKILHSCVENPVWCLQSQRSRRRSRSPCGYIVNAKVGLIAYLAHCNNRRIKAKLKGLPRLSLSTENKPFQQPDVFSPDFGVSSTATQAQGLSPGCFPLEELDDFDDGDHDDRQSQCNAVFSRANGRESKGIGQEGDFQDCGGQQEGTDHRQP